MRSNAPDRIPSHAPNSAPARVPGAATAPRRTPGLPIPNRAGANHAERRRAPVVLSGFAAAHVWTPVLAVRGARYDATVRTWIAAVGWSIVTSFVRAPGDGIRHGDWLALT